MRNIMVTALVLAGVTASANADSVDLTFAGRGLGWGHKITFDGASTNYVFTGELLHGFSGGTGSLSALNGLTLATFSVEVGQPLAPGAAYDAVDLASLPGSGGESLGMGADRAQAIRGVVAHADSIDTVDVTDARNLAAALQLVIWEIVYEFNPQLDGGIGSIDITGGRFSATQTRDDRPLSRGIMNHFNTLREIGINFGAGANLLGLSNSENQDQILRSVPLPSAAGMGLASLGMIASRRRR